jgi:hypothetical protein
MKCIFCDREGSHFVVLGRYICGSCWDIIAIIALKAIKIATNEKFSEAITEIERGE